MSQGNVEIVRRWRDSWAKRDVPALLGYINQEAELDFSNAEGPFKGVYRGRAEVIGFCRSVWDAWDEHWMEFEDEIECGDECLVTPMVIRAKGRSSGIDVAAHAANLWQFRDAKISRCKLFQTTSEALEAVGLSEEDAHADA